MAIKNRLYTYPNGQPSDGNKLQAEFDNVYGATQGVASDQLASDSVTTEKLVNGSVTEPKLASNSVNTLKLVDLAVTDAKVATGISQSKLSATGWVTDIVIASALASSQAETTANTASATASTANTKADTAVSTANTASTTANTANTKADTAITTANTAKLTADTVSADYSVQLPLINAGLDSIALKVDKTYVDASIAELIVGTMPDGSVTNAKLDANLKSKIIQADANATAIGSGTLSTTSQNLIGAVNDINTNADMLETKQGNLTLLTTTVKTSLVGAVNELKASALTSTEVNAMLTPESILTKIKTVDGTSSGLDSDLLDGKHASDFSLTSHTHAVPAIATQAQVDAVTLNNVYVTPLGLAGLKQSVVNGKQAVVNAIDGSVGASGLTTNSTHADYAWWITNKVAPSQSLYGAIGTKVFANGVRNASIAYSASSIVSIVGDVATFNSSTNIDLHAGLFAIKITKISGSGTKLYFYPTTSMCVCIAGSDLKKQFADHIPLDSVSSTSSWLIHSFNGSNSNTIARVFMSGGSSVVQVELMKLV